MPTWTAEYEGNTLPVDGGWTRTLGGSGGLSAEEIVSGELHVSTGSTASVIYSKSAVPITFTFVLRGRVVDATNPILQLIRGTSGVSLGFSLLKSGGASYYQALDGALHAIDWTANHIYRYGASIAGGVHSWKVWIDEASAPTFTGSTAWPTPTDLGWRAATGTEYYLDYLKYATQGVYGPDDLPVGGTSLPLTGEGHCEVAKRINTILSGRSSFGFVTAAEGSHPARATADAFVIDYLGQRKPLVWPSLDSAKVRGIGLGGHYRHEEKWKVWLVLEDLKRVKGMTLGAVAEDIRAAFNDGNGALNALVDIEFSRVRAVRLLPLKDTYPYPVLEADLEVWVSRRFTDSAGTYTAGSTNPRTVAKAIVDRLHADLDFEAVTFYEEVPQQPAKWPACWVQWQDHVPRVHPTDEHFPMRFKLVFEDFALKETRVCRLMKWAFDLEDRVHAEPTLNNTTGVRKWALTGYEMRVRRDANYSYDQLAADVTVQVDV